MSLLNRDAILTADDLTSEVVDVPEWGGQVRLRVLTGAERDKFEASISADGKKINRENLRARFVVLCVVDDDGQRIFTDADASKLGLKSASALDRLFTKAQRMNGLSDEDVETLAGNSESATGGASTSDSPATSD